MRKIKQEIMKFEDYIYLVDKQMLDFSAILKEITNETAFQLQRFNFWILKGKSKRFSKDFS